MWPSEFKNLAGSSKRCKTSLGNCSLARLSSFLSTKQAKILGWDRSHSLWKVSKLRLCTSPWKEFSSWNFLMSLLADSPLSSLSIPVVIVGGKILMKSPMHSVWKSPKKSHVTTLQVKWRKSKENHQSFVYKMGWVFR